MQMVLRPSTRLNVVDGGVFEVVAEGWNVDNDALIRLGRRTQFRVVPGEMI